jgi:HEAT repeat protein
MRRSCLILSLLAAPALVFTPGCASRVQSVKTIGIIPPGERAADLRDDRIRRLGVDHAPSVPLNEPFYVIPFTAMSAGFNVVFVEPSARLYRYFTHDDAATAARNMLDTTNADKRRAGILRLAEESYARQGVPETDLWADLAKRDPDYTVRAAAIRALNWSRDPRHTDVFIAALNDEHPLVRLEAAKALANIPDQRAAGPLAELLSDINRQDISKDVRIASADALRCYKNDESAHALIAVLSDANFAVAWQARQSLRLMTAHDFQYDERAWLGFLSESKNPFE